MCSTTQTASQRAKAKYTNKLLTAGGVEMNITSPSIDLAKTFFSIVGINQAEKIVLRKMLNRDKPLTFITKCPLCLADMKAGSGAHYWGREHRNLGQALSPPNSLRSITKEAIRQTPYSACQLTTSLMGLVMCGA